MWSWSFGITDTPNFTPLVTFRNCCLDSASLLPSMFLASELKFHWTELVWVCFFHIGSWGTCLPSVVCLNLYEQPSSLEKDKNRCHRTASHFKNGKRFGGFCVSAWSRGVRKWWTTIMENLVTLFFFPKNTPVRSPIYKLQFSENFHLLMNTTKLGNFLWALYKVNMISFEGHSCFHGVPPCYCDDLKWRVTENMKGERHENNPWPDQ